MPTEKDLRSRDDLYLNTSFPAQDVEKHHELGIEQPNIDLFAPSGAKDWFAQRKSAKKMRELELAWKVDIQKANWIHWGGEEWQIYLDYNQAQRESEGNTYMPHAYENIMLTYADWRIGHPEASNFLCLHVIDSIYRTAYMNYWIFGLDAPHELANQLPKGVVLRKL
ncbi:MAG: hypothetical protein K8L97_06055 [Anaerolineae bacterium]|nr:hypothetical protein [Anaerolineae bacterium]